MSNDQNIASQNPAVTFSQLDGVFVLDKPIGPSSAQCLGIFKKLGQKKVGHAGTLDPLASGVLLVLLGQATKLSSWLLEGGKKIYTGVLRLGVETDTWDITGAVLKECAVNVRAEDVNAAVAAWKDLQSQPVPPYSAAKHQGRPLYKLARKGEAVPAKVKNIRITEAVLLDYNNPFARFRVSCSSGSYIRSLAHSLGMRLGCGAALCGLTREYSHPYGIADASGLEELRRNPQILPERIKPLSGALPDWPALETDAALARAARNGKPLPASALAAGANAARAILLSEGAPLALVAKDADGAYWRVLRGLWN